MKAYFAAITLFTAPAFAETPPLALPLGAVETFAQVEDPAEYMLPTAPFDLNHKPSLSLNGRLETRVWRIPSEQGDTAVLAGILRPQIQKLGYTEVFACAEQDCGGFDFRFNIDVVPPPRMQVSLTDFRFLSAKGPEGTFIDLLISASGDGGFVQIHSLAPSQAILPETALPASLVVGGSLAVAGNVGDVAAQLSDPGRVVLRGVTFEPAAQGLSEQAIAALTPLADAMAANPELEVILVGHTDNAGSLGANIALSRQRAEAVRDILIDQFGISAGRLGAEGAGYLSPIAPNTTEAGRALNRRVEAIAR